jgi:hypothetical protein
LGFVGHLSWKGAFHLDEPVLNEPVDLLVGQYGHVMNRRNARLVGHDAADGFDDYRRQFGPIIATRSRTKMPH